ncbi:hypothetical protein SV7mr_18850 [Stieleria bergensis]|uniref:Uncharacterized protein n=1 Tax=Stieleria bergensis TaxID=2528025 RepID=A0A517STC0_9BACT|nr:hypothetical protein SV7mr_18850 [Planctomycetes bacterium SV_7m_r]
MMVQSCKAATLMISMAGRGGFRCGCLRLALPRFVDACKHAPYEPAHSPYESLHAHYEPNPGARKPECALVQSSGLNRHLADTVFNQGT